MPAAGRDLPSRARHRRGPALVALCAAALGALVIAASANHQARPATRSAAAAGHTPQAARLLKKPAPTARARSPVPTGTTSAKVAAGDSAALEARGHQLMVDGSYGQAIAVLREAIAAAPPTSLTFAYALYDLGRSLRLSGDAQAAIPILKRRLEIPNQSGAVSQELAIAEREAGAPASVVGGTASTGAAPQSSGPQPFDYKPSADKHRGHGKHGGDQQTD